MKNFDVIENYFSKMEFLDFYRFEDEDDIWFFLNRKDSDSTTKIILDSSNFSFDFIVIGTNQNGNYILLNEFSKLLNYDSKNFSLIDFDLSLEDILSFK